MTGRKFPEDFRFGVSTSAYQIEGGWDADGKGESIWDYYVHHQPHRIEDRKNGDISCDSYHKVDIDVENLKKLKVHFYRFSVSWTRILPTGFPNKINQPGIDYYNSLIDKLILNGIEPVITLFHWDSPKSLEDLGGWCSPHMTDYFVSFARVCFKHFGDRVKTWITINEPYLVAELAYGGTQTAPFFNSQGIGSYLAAHYMLLGHAKVYRLYDKEFRATQKGRVGLTCDSRWAEPYTQNVRDIEAAERFMQMDFGWFCHSMYKGDYPPIMRECIDKLSKEQGFDYSRLPKFTKEEVQMLLGSSDFLGLNHYNTVAIVDENWGHVPSNKNDMHVRPFYPVEFKKNGSDLFRVVPWGMRKLLNWIKREYNNPEVMIFENGYAGFTNETLDDLDRIDYMKSYMGEVLKAILDDGCNVTAYTFWSLMDNFEWQSGYLVPFGLFKVDFNDPERKRTPKRSAFVYQDIIVTRSLDNPLPTKFLH